MITLSDNRTYTKFMNNFFNQLQKSFFRKRRENIKKHTQIGDAVNLIDKVGEKYVFTDEDLKRKTGRTSTNCYTNSSKRSAESNTDMKAVSCELSIK